MDPQIGIIYERDSHPALKNIADLGDESKLGSSLCDAKMPLSEAMAKEWDNDAHFIMYVVHADEKERAFMRVSKRSPFVHQLGAHGGFIAVSVLAFDYDLPKVGDRKQEWTEAGLAEYVEGLASSDLPSPTHWYTTLHGCRFVYVLTEPVDHLRAERLCQGIIRDFAGQGIELDRACSDWTRLFRLPATVREDSGRSFADDPRFALLSDPDTLLDPDTVVEPAAGETDTFAAVEDYDGDQPDPDECHALLHEVNDRGREVRTEWNKRARQLLQGREAFGVVFEDKELDVEGHGGWNNALTKLVGQIVGMTARCEEATPEGVFALVQPTCAELTATDDEGQRDWLEIGWDQVVRFWNQEQSQIAVELREKEAGQAEARVIKGEIIANLRDEKPDLVPDTAAEAEEWLEQRMIASDGTRHYVMREDGGYNLRAVPDAMLVPMIKELGMEEVIPIEELRGKSIAPRSSRDILNAHATPVIKVQCSSAITSAFIDGAQGYKVLNVPVHQLNPKVLPRYDADVAEWLQHVVGDDGDLLVDWLSHCLDVTSPICALDMHGAPGAGKNMLAQGIAECFQYEEPNDGTAFDRFNLGLLDSPLVWCDEGVPNMAAAGNAPLDQQFRRMVSGGKLSLQGKFKDVITAMIYPRLLFTSNNLDILQTLVGYRDITDDDIQAIEVRLLSLRVPASARTFMNARGNYRFTNRWVAGRSGNDYRLASHIRWLHENRTPSPNSSGRLLVEGTRGNDLVRSLRLRSKSAEAALRLLVSMMDAPKKPSGYHEHEGRVWVTASGLVEYMERPSNMDAERFGLKVAGRVLRIFAPLESVDDDGHQEKTRPPGSDHRGRWFEIDLPILYEEALRYGMNVKAVEALLKQTSAGRIVVASRTAEKPTLDD